QVGKQYMTDLYNGTKTSAEKMASSAKSSATNMYKGVTTSTSKMANQAIADWNRVKNAYATSITGKINITKTTTSIAKTVTQSTQSAFNTLRNSYNTLSDELTPIAFKSTDSVSALTSVALDEEIEKKLEEQLKKTKEIEDKITQLYQKEVE